MDLVYAPRRLVVEYERKGYRLLPNHDYSPSDYAILMVYRGVEAPETVRLPEAAPSLKGPSGNRAKADAAQIDRLIRKVPA